MVRFLFCAVAFAAACSCLQAVALQFDLNAGATKCLGEEVGANLLARGAWSVVGAPTGAATQLTVRVTRPNGEEEYSSNTAAAGEFSFTGEEEGLYRVCFSNGSGMRRRLELDFRVGIDARDYGSVARAEHLLPIEMELRKLEDRAEEVYREFLYQREREARHRDTNESTNERVLWLTAASVALLVAVAALQLLVLYRFLVREKHIAGSPFLSPKGVVREALGVAFGQKDR